MTGPQVVDFKTMSEVRSIDKLIRDARSIGKLRIFNVAASDEVEVISYRTGDIAAAEQELTIMFCDRSEEGIPAVGMLILSPDQWRAVRELGDDIIEQMKELPNNE